MSLRTSYDLRSIRFHLVQLVITGEVGETGQRVRTHVRYRIRRTFQNGIEKAIQVHFQHYFLLIVNSLTNRFKAGITDARIGILNILEDDFVDIPDVRLAL